MRRLLGPLFAFSLILLACGDDEGTDTETRNDESVDEEEGQQAASLLDECELFDPDDARALVTNSDTGERKIEGEILSSVIVESADRVPDDAPVGAGAPIGVVAINVDGTIVTLAHGIDTVTYFALDAGTADLVGFPEGSAVGVEVSEDAIDTARKCAESETFPTTTAPASGFDVEAWRSEAVDRFGPEEVHDDGSKDDYVQLARTICGQSEGDRRTMVKNLGDRYEGSLQQFIIEEFCPNA